MVLEKSKKRLSEDQVGRKDVTPMLKARLPREGAGDLDPDRNGM